MSKTNKFHRTIYEDIYIILFSKLFIYLNQYTIFNFECLISIQKPIYINIKHGQWLPGSICIRKLLEKS